MTSQTAENLNPYDPMELLPDYGYDRQMQLDTSLMIPQERENLQQAPDPQPRSFSPLEIPYESLDFNFPAADQEFTPLMHGHSSILSSGNTPIPRTDGFNEFISNDAPFLSDWTCSMGDVDMIDTSFTSGYACQPPSAMVGIDLLQRERCVIEGDNVRNLSRVCRGGPTEDICSNDTSKHYGETEEVVEVTEISNSIERFSNKSTAPVISEGLKPLLGLAHPISLPRARTGGRKGPLSAQEREGRRESRKQGVCIRCRKMKEKVGN